MIISNKNKVNRLIYYPFLVLGLFSLYLFNFTKYRLGGELIFYFNGVYTLVMIYLTKTLLPKK